MRSWTVTTLLAVAACASAYAADAADRLPAGANAVVSIDVPKVLSSEIAKANDWRAKMTRSAYDRPLAVPANATQVTTAAMLDLNTLTPRWQASLIAAPGQLNTERLAASGGGYVDKIAGVDVVTMPNETYYAQRDGGMIGAFWPAQRQALSRWFASSNRPQGLSETLAAGIKSDAAYVIVVDTAEAYSPAGMFHAIRNGGYPSLDKFEGDLAEVAEALSSISSVKLTANFGTGIQGELTVNFGKSVDLVGPYAKQLVSDAIAEAGLSSGAIEKWSFTAKGNQITGSGPISQEMLSYFGTLFTPPAPPQQLTTEGTEAANNAGANPAADASAAYFKAVTRSVDGINFGQASLKQTAQYLRTQALAIERLPVLHVDPALQDWGTSVAQAYNRGAQICLTGQNQAIASVQGVQSPTANTTYGTSYNSTSTAQSRADFRNAQTQRREAGASQRAQTIDAVTATLNEAIAPRGDLKKQMTQKYQVEF